MYSISARRASARMLQASSASVVPLFSKRGLSSSSKQSPFSVFLANKSSRTLFRLSSVFSFARTNLSRQLPLQRPRRFNSTSLNSSTPQQAQNAKPAKKEGYLKRLSKKYGVSVVYIYIGLSLLDYPVCFAVVHTLGQEKISEWEDIVSEYAKPVTDYVKEMLQSIGVSMPERKEHPVPETEDQTSQQHKPSLLTEAAIAYGIHKSLIFIRLPLAAAITPPIVKFMQQHFPKMFVSSARGVTHPDIKRRFFGGLF
ncbi:hypothetical protein POJ06DRAFT_261490 [Lipomyces tetrasporus]|uniref:DUF1279 domain-containing protein n=1 Tax=Lipomyces tetrasporus TaxID=54092 RepID=A0AAD7VQD3_9ASCO|nr:uncharacterized protein POJ06DRAFT_261490 [Lipomyces tetrasporus]KAJ8097479.1 hypothetical protein POJ06DRAFT_261490 [Lipomyces tetrasporus]